MDATKRTLPPQPPNSHDAQHRTTNTILQHKYYANILNIHFTPEQNRDTRFNPPSTNIPLTQIFITECNPEKDILTNNDAIQIHNEQTHIYENTGRHLITIPTTRLKWLWQQYNKVKYNTHGLVPPTQTFEKEVVWLYQRYKSKIFKNSSTKTTLHTLPTNIMDSLITTFNISHSYFSSPVSCSTKISKFYSLFGRDKVFGALGTAFQFKWKGIGYAHPHNEKTANKQSIGRD